MACSFDHFLLRFQMSVEIVSHKMRNMLVEILNLQEKRCGIIIYKWKVLPVEECDRLNHIVSIYQQ